MLLLFITFFVALLSGLGVGSAGLLVTWLVFIEEMPQLQAQGLNLLFFLFSGSAALCVHLFRTPLLGLFLLVLLPSGFLGTFWGTKLALVLPQALLRKLFGWLLILSGAIGLFRKKEKIA